MIIRAFADALGQLDDPRLRRAIWLGLGLALVLLFALYAGVVALIQLVTPESLTLPILGEVHGLSVALSVASLAVMLVLSVFLMVPIASAFTGLFLEGVADAVEARHYPALPPAEGQPLGPAIADSLRYFVLLVALNVLGLIVTLLTAGTGIVVVWLINGYLLSREYFTTVALRRMTPADAHRMRRANLPRLWAAGVVMAIPLSVPLVNLVMPVIGAAAFTHLFHRIAMR